MQKLILWATYVASALATLDTVFPIVKRDTDCTNSSNTQQKDTTDDGVIQITVGNNGTLRYFPEDVGLTGLPVGTIIQFNFMPKNHTVTESTFAEPCVPVAANVTQATHGRDPIKTGFVPVTGNETFTKAFRIMLSDTKPIWLYCGQKMHCQSGMSMVINQNVSDTTNKTLANYKAAAALVPVPGASSSTSVAPSSSSTASAYPVTPDATTSVAANGPSLAASATASGTAPVVSVFNGGAVPTQRPMRLAAMGGMAVVGAVALL